MRSPGMIAVTKLVTCRRCGDQQLAWVQAKSGKWYLARAYVIPEHGQHYLEANKFEAHKCASLPARMVP